VLKQDQNVPLPVERQTAIMYALVNGYMDDVEIPKIRDFEAAFHRFMDSNHPEILKSIADTKAITDETEQSLKAAAEEFKTSVPY
jgi:F-type H+-transporting ATPase subunit alpha